MKKLLCLALALMMALTLFGCRAETAATEAPAEETPAEAPAEAPAEEATEAPAEDEAESRQLLHRDRDHHRQRGVPGFRS